jgi:hypothetical protein
MDERDQRREDEEELVDEETADPGRRVQPVHHDVEQPAVGDPRPARLGPRERVDRRGGAVLDDPLPRSDVPPDVGIDHGLEADHDGQRVQDDEQDQVADRGAVTVRCGAARGESGVAVRHGRRRRFPRCRRH